MYSEEQLTIFAKVVESGSFSKVALDLGRSQSAVSIAIRNLEEALGYRVFDRLGKRVQLNYQGEQLYQLCQRRIVALSRLHKIADNLHHAIESEVAIYIDCEVDPLPIAALLEKFHRCFPFTQIVMQQTWQSASLLIVPEEPLADETAENGWNWQLYSEDTLLPVSGPAANHHTQYIEVPWGPKSPTRHHLMTSKPTIALQMVLGNMGWCWLPRFLLAQYQCGLDYKTVTNIEPITRRYVLGVSKEKGPALQWLNEQALASQVGDKL
ncbi:LysR family transcriptional regulator [Photobacterium sagamiensis]|uniref:LysR family transcriptional regulator n=1 Tax=Photobacterium sagamiensis TaxID=2910241 RepID=UPI003D118B3B